MRKNFLLSLFLAVCAAGISTFAQDATAPQVVSTASLDGYTVAVCFDEEVDPLTANDPANYGLSDGGLIFSAILQADGRTVALEVTQVLSGYTLTVNGVTDSAGNAVVNGSATGTVLGFMAQDIGTVFAPGAALACAEGEVDVWARGLDIWGYADSGHFVAEEQSGDFDVRVQVESLEAPGMDATAGLMVRESWAAGSRNISVVVYPTQRNWTGARRVETDGASSVLDGNWRINWPEGIDYPNAWLRLRRSGNSFTAYGSTNGTEWVQIGNTVVPAVPYPDLVLLGLRTTPTEITAPDTTAYAKYRNYGDYEITGATISIVEQPQAASAFEYLTATFSVAAEVEGTSPSNLTYQWQRNGVDIPGATQPAYTTGQLNIADSGSEFRVIISLPGGSSITSEAALLTVQEDLVAPVIVSTASLDGTTVGVCVDEPLDPVTANDPAQYSVSGGTVIGAVLQDDNTTVVLTVSGLTGGNYTVNLAGVTDLAGNAVNASADGLVMGLSPADLGDVPEPGRAISCAPGAVDVWARGADIWGEADSGHFVSESRTGDFDVRVRVERFTAPAISANAGLMVRENLNAGSRNIGVVVYANQAIWLSGQRAETDGISSVLPGNWQVAWPEGVGYPEIWVRLKRSGDTFTAYGSTDGLDWVQVGDSVTPAVPYPETVLVGMRTTPVEVQVQGSTAYVEYREYGEYALPEAAINIVEQPVGATVLENETATFAVTAEVVGAPSSNLAYQWLRDGEEIQGATEPAYTTGLLTAGDDGAVYTVRLSLPGGAEVVSEPVTLTVTQDVTPPQLISAATLDGFQVGVSFNEPVDPATANDAANFSLDAGAVVFSAALQQDGRTVLLETSTLAGEFTVTANGVADLSGNNGETSVTGEMLDLFAQDIGAVQGPGLAVSYGEGSVDVWARGEDIWGEADSGHFVYEERTGDFDVKVQVPYFEAPAPDANAGLGVRESMAAGSRNINVVVYANMRNWTATQRIETDGASSVFPGEWRIEWAEGESYPDVWLRLKREGNTFTTYGSNDGVAWTQIGEAVTPEVPYPDTILLGLRTTPVEVEVPGSTGYVQYRHYGEYTAGETPELEVSASGEGEVALSWPAAGTENFVLEFTTDLAGGTWNPVAESPSVEDNVRVMQVPATESNGFFRLRR